jgi:Ner family transcriptional regulator
MARFHHTRGWHPEDIKAALRKRGWTLQAVAKEAGVSHTAVSTCLRSGASADARSVIAKILGTDPAVIWPDRYPQPLTS